MTQAVSIRVSGEGEYEVIIGHGVLDRLIPMLKSSPAQVAVIHASAVGDVAREVSAMLEAAGTRPLLIEVPESEAAKTAEVAARCWALLGAAAFTRSDAVVGVGGGATTDLAGFVAATWLRGVDHVEIPTTLLGMVDAAVGGKTGINTAEGKNLVGAFHPPVGVLCDLDRLTTLPAADYAAGLAEVVKCGFIRDPRILELIEADLSGCAVAGNAVEVELISRAIAVKAAVVSDDLRESTTATVAGLAAVTGREVLNYGHTFGHAIELAEGYSWRHGDAISVGMVFVAELARSQGLIDEELVARHRNILSGLGLPTSYSGASWAQLLEAMGRDKKTRGGTLRFVVLAGVAEPVLLAAPPEQALLEAFHAVSG